MVSYQEDYYVALNDKTRCGSSVLIGQDTVSDYNVPCVHDYDDYTQVQCTVAVQVYCTVVVQMHC